MFASRASDLAQAQEELASIQAILAEIERDCEALARDESITIAERRTWRAIARKCHHALSAAHF